MERLGFSVKDPVILARDVDSGDITVQFVTGPNLPRTQYTVKCVVEGGDCEADAEGTSVEGFLPVTKNTIQETITDLNPDTAYTCFVKTYYREDGLLNICKEAKIIPGSVGFQLSYEVFGSAAEFSEADEEQVCANFKDFFSPLVSEPTCTIFGVADGSAVVSGEVTYENYQEAAFIFKILEQAKGGPDQEACEELLNDGDESLTSDIFDENGDQSMLEVTRVTLSAAGPYRYKPIPYCYMYGSSMPLMTRRLNRKRFMF